MTGFTMDKVAAKTRLRKSHVKSHWCKKKKKSGLWIF